ncbi:MAG: flagellar basal body P-ring protein FlgI [Planctomycetota bacterium]|nr:flagellar basal body P-ring protein FlgI [Planctomycetota bacterium]
MTRLAITFCLLMVSLGANLDGAVRVKDLTSIQGARNNQIYGVGLVVGLDRTGARFQSLATQQMAIDMLRKLNVTAKIARQNLQDNVFVSNTISMVMVTAELTPFAREGSRLDVTVSVMDTASSLKGGTLLFTPLKAADGEVYAVAQGPITLGGTDLSVIPSIRGQRNHPTSGRVNSGAIVEQEALGEIVDRGKIHLLLKNPDYTTAEKIAKRINVQHATNQFATRTPSNVRAVAYQRPKSRVDSSPIAFTIDAGTIAVYVPEAYRYRIAHLVGEIGQLEVTPDSLARVVINERTGTVIVGSHVKINSVAIAHGSLVIKPEDPPPAPPGPGPAAQQLLGVQGAAPQPAGNPFGGFQDAFLQPGELPAGDKLNVINKTFTVADLAQSLNALGVTPRDLISIFQALKEAGALHAELIIM